jgi:Na+/H+-dicarboxylate symporter
VIHLGKVFVMIAAGLLVVAFGAIGGGWVVSLAIPLSLFQGSVIFLGAACLGALIVGFYAIVERLSRQQNVLVQMASVVGIDDDDDFDDEEDAEWSSDSADEFLGRKGASDGPDSIPF